MFATFSYAIRNQKTGEYSTVETYSPLEGDHIGWGKNNDGTPADWDVIHDDVIVNLRCDDGTVIPVRGNTLRRLYRDLTIVFQTDYFDPTADVWASIARDAVDDYLYESGR